MRDTPRLLPGRSSLLAAVVAAEIVLIVCIIWLPRLEARLDPLTGDEPFYVMTSISLFEDRDLDETNNYAARQFDRFYPAFGPTSDGWESYPDPLPPHQSDTVRAGLYSKHGLGLSLLIALPYEVGGRILVLFTLTVIAALLAANMTLLACHYTDSPILAAAIATALALTNPLLSFSLLIFPEMTSALAITYAARRLLLNRNNAWQSLGIGVCIAVLPWLHYRLAVVSVALALVVVIRFRHHRSRVAMAFAAPVISAGLLAWWHHRLYSRPFPPGSDHAGFSNLSGTINGLAGTFLDQQWGAFIHNPLLILASGAAILFVWQQRRDAAVLAALVLPYLLLISAYRVWWGEWNPPARYLTDIVPLAVAPLAWAFNRVMKPWRWPLLISGCLPAFAIMATFLTDPQRMYNHPDGSSRLLETWRRWTGIDLTASIPSFVSYSQSPLLERLPFGVLGCAWVVTAATLFSTLARTQSQQQRIGSVVRRAAYDDQDASDPVESRALEDHRQLR